MSELRDELLHDFRDEEYAHTYAEEFLNASIATQIKVLREQRNMSQQELAEKTGMRQERISVLENVNYGSWSVKTLKRLARAFDVTLRVSFETFGSRIGDIVNFNRNALQREDRHSELVKNDLPNGTTSAAIIDMFAYANTMNKPQKFTKIDAPKQDEPPRQPRIERG